MASFKSLEEEAHLSIQRTAALLEHTFETALKPHRITATQYNVLRILKGSEPDGLCRSEIGQRLVRQVPDVTRLLDRLEDAIRDDADHEDRVEVAAASRRTNLRNPSRAARAPERATASGADFAARDGSTSVIGNKARSNECYHN
jgi:hypothetical protein